MVRRLIGVVVNRNAAGARRPGLAERLAALCGDDGAVRQTRTPGELASVLDEFAARGCDLVAMCGGDGTNLATITAAVRSFGEGALPRFALLRGGTVNTVARNLGIGGTPEQILAALVRRRRAGTPVREVGQDLLDVEGRFGFLFAAGMGARFLERYYAGPVLGVPWASVLAARTVLSSLVKGGFARSLFEPLPCTLVADGAELPIAEVRLLVASVVADVGIGMRVAWRAGQQPNRFHVVASALPMRSMALQLGRVIAGEALAGGPHVDLLARELEVRFTRPQSFTLDGELFREERVRVRVGPRIWIEKP